VIDIRRMQMGQVADADVLGADPGLVRGVTHAVLNELAVVRLLLDACRAGQPETLDTAESIVTNAAELLGELGSLARQGEEPVEADLRSAVGHIGRLLTVAAGPAATVVVETASEPVVARVDARALQEALLGAVASLGATSPAGTVLRVTVAPGPVVAVDGQPVIGATA
jgi:signal transduction histidine kinase